MLSYFNMYHGTVITVYIQGITTNPVYVRDHPNMFFNVHGATRDAQNPHKPIQRAHFLLLSVSITNLILLWR